MCFLGFFYFPFKKGDKRGVQITCINYEPNTAPSGFFPNNSVNIYYYNHFKNKEIETQRLSGFLKVGEQLKWQSQGLNSGLGSSKPVVFLTCSVPPRSTAAVDFPFEEHMDMLSVSS